MQCSKCGHDPSAKVVACWTFLIERDAPSLNARMVNSGPRGFLYRRERDTWCWELRAVRLLRKMPKATGRRRVTLTRIYGGQQKERDVDNLIGGAKCVVDALVDEGMLKDDSPALAEIHYAQSHGRPRGMLFTIEELA